jgi:Tfp pilus assembly protein PilN
MTNGVALNLNLATRPLRNRRLYTAVVRALALLLVVLAGLAAFVVLKYGGQASRIKSSSAETRTLLDDAGREQKRLAADIEKEERLGQARVNLVNGIIQRKMFRWTALLSELERALPGPSYITGLSPGFTTDGSLTMKMQVTSRSLEDLLTFITDLTARGFKNIQVFGETRSEDGRLLTEISLTHERAF